MGQAGHEDTGEVWRLRRAVVQHPVHRWASGSYDRTTLLIHKGFCQWGATSLAASVATGQPGHLMADITDALRSRGAAAALERFLDEVGHGTDAVVAVAVSGAPDGVGPLVGVISRLLSAGSESARLGAMALGLPCCDDDQAWALNRLAMLTTGDPSVNVAAVAAARRVLEAQVGLFDAAADTIRRRHMTMHPSAPSVRVGGSGLEPAPVTVARLQPAG